MDDARDAEDFGQFMASRWAGLVRLAYGLTGDRWLAEDIAQSALASAFAAWWRVRRAGDPDAYVRRILINTSNRRFRKHRVAENPRAGGAAGRRRRGAVAARLAGLAVTVADRVHSGRQQARKARSGRGCRVVEAQGDAERARSRAPGGLFGSGTVNGTAWRMRVTLGGDGECFAATIGAAGAGGASVCRPVGLPPAAAAFTYLPFATPGHVVLWYPGTVSARTAYLRADLSNGRTTRLVPVVVGGRKYFTLAPPIGVTARRLTLYDAAGHAFASTTAITPPR